jgi:hypothetical protein
MRGRRHMSSTSVQRTRLVASPNGRYFQTDRGDPFFYLGDVAWTLLKRLDVAEARDYFADRAAKGFTVIHAYVLRGLKTPNLHGAYTLLDGDPARPTPAFFEHVDALVDAANGTGLFMGLVVTYGAHVRRRDKDSDEQIFTPANAVLYGQYLGRRYRDHGVLWYLGGDRQPEDRDTWIAMARGLKDGCGGSQLVSYHGPGPRELSGYSSSFWFHGEDWLDFNAIQSGHRWTVPRHQFVAHDYAMSPAKPTLDMEPTFENHFVADVGRRTPGWKSREAAYVNLLAGAAGHGYGCNDVYQFHDPGSRKPSYRDAYFPFDTWSADTPWRTALDFEGARSMRHVRDLFEKRPWHALVPDLSVIAGGQGEGELHIQAARAGDGSFVIAYLGKGQPVTIGMDRLAGSSARAQWYDPRTGEWSPAGEWPTTGVREFTPPSHGDGNDWVIVIDGRGERS